VDVGEYDISGAEGSITFVTLLPLTFIKCLKKNNNKLENICVK
jgi:hypothetical protein